jgi:hypothetical protein
MAMTDDLLDPRGGDDVGHGCFAINPGGDVIVLTDEIRDALIARGDLRCVDGVWYISDINISDDTPWLVACDFCAERPVVWNVRCESFVQGTFEFPGAFSMCETCGRLIQQGDRTGLLNRSLARVVAEAKGQPFDAVVLQETHDLFWEHYLGQVEPVRARHFGHGP